MTNKIISSLGLSVLLLTTTLSAGTIPNPPGPYVGVYKVTETTARISFLDNSTNEDGFKVYIHDQNDIFDATVVPNPILVPQNNNGNLNQYANITNLTPNTFYKLRVTAYNTTGESIPTIASSIQNGRIKTSPPVCKPVMPGEYVGTYNITDTSARISFLDNSNNEDGFKVYVYNATTKALVKTITVDALSGIGAFQYVNIDGLVENTVYTLAVTAFTSGCGESIPTHASSITNGRFRTTSQTTTTCPLMPGGYVGTYNVTNNSARISFLDNSDNEDGFKVYLYDQNTNALITTKTLPAVSGLGGFQYANLTGLNANSHYAVRVSAFSSSCESDKTLSSSLTNGRFKTLP